MSDLKTAIELQQALAEAEKQRQKAQQEALRQQAITNLSNQYQQMQSRLSQQATGGYGGGGGGAGGSIFTGLASVSGGLMSATMAGSYTDEEPEKITLRNKNITLGQAKNLVLNILKTPMVPFLWGPPGVGKSTLVRDICREKNWQLIDLRLSLLNPVDLRGLPIVDRKLKLAEWLPPSFLPNGHTKGEGILFLDEINLAPLSVQAAAYQLILDKRVGEYKFPAHWKLVAAGNRETDRANVYKISAPLANRFIHLNIMPDFTAWRIWAEKNIRNEIINFLILQPTLLFKMPIDSEKAFPSPRTWEFLSKLMDTFNYKEENGVDDDLKQVICGTIGDSVGTTFIKFLESYKLKEISKSVEEFIKTGKIRMPKAISMRYALITAIYDAHKSKKVGNDKWKYFVENKITAEEKKAVEKFEVDVSKRPSLDTNEEGPNQQAFLVNPIGRLEQFIEISGNTIAFDGPTNNKGAIAFLTPSGYTMEIAHYIIDDLGPNGIVKLKIFRGQNGTIPYALPAGTQIVKMP